jgi:hypothetical protein
MKNCPIFFKTLSEVRSKTIATFQKLKSEDHYPNYMDDVEGRIYRGIWMEGEEEDYEQVYILIMQGQIFIFLIIL